MSKIHQPLPDCPQNNVNMSQEQWLQTMAQQEPEDFDFSDDDSYSSDGYDDAQEQWEESMRQLRALVSLVIVPLAGKFLGRRFAYYCKCETSLESKGS